MIFFKARVSTMISKLSFAKLNELNGGSYQFYMFSNVVSGNLLSSCF